MRGDIELMGSPIPPTRENPAQRECWMSDTFSRPSSFCLFALPLTLFDMGGHDVPQNVFGHCAQMRRRRKLKLGNF